MTVHTLNYSNCNSCGIDRIFGNSVCLVLLLNVTRNDEYALENSSIYYVVDIPPILPTFPNKSP